MMRLPILCIAVTHPLPSQQRSFVLDGRNAQASRSGVPLVPLYLNRAGHLSVGHLIADLDQAYTAVALAR